MGGCIYPGEISRVENNAGWVTIAPFNLDGHFIVQHGVQALF
jgi:hypothetical protein